MYVDGSWKFEKTELYEYKNWLEKSFEKTKQVFGIASAI